MAACYTFHLICTVSPVWNVCNGAAGYVRFSGRKPLPPPTCSPPQGLKGKIKRIKIHSMSCLHWWKMLIGEGLETFLTFADSYGGSCWFSVWILQYVHMEANIVFSEFDLHFCHVDASGLLKKNKKKERKKLQPWCHPCKIAGSVSDIAKRNSFTAFTGSWTVKSKFQPFWRGDYQNKCCPR